MNSRIVVTADGSRTLTADESGSEIYHSRHGALQESRYVFIQQGLDALPPSGGEAPQPIRLLEVGFGTGLNALLALQWAQTHSRPLHYVGLEPHRLPAELLAELEYPQLLAVSEEAFTQLHRDSRLDLPSFSARIESVGIEEYHPEEVGFHLCWFDAFSPRYQAVLWTEAVFKQLFDLLAPGGRLVTYSAKGDVQRALKATGFDLEKLPGPPGKREMLRATRPA